MPIIHDIRILHKDIYSTSEKLSKRDKLGIHTIIESLCLEILSLSVESAFKPRNQKKPVLEGLRIKLEILKHLVRTEHELKVIDAKTYLRLGEQIVTISKMVNGWINSLPAITQNPHNMSG